MSADWLASLFPSVRDAEAEERLGIGTASADAPGEHLIGYHASGVAAIVRTLIEVPVVAGDVVVDLGAGLGKVVMLSHLLTGATARGVELQPDLVRRAREAAARLAMRDVTFAQGDARDADLDDGTVFFLYVPFTGAVLEDVLRRLQAVAARRAIVVCCLGVEVDREAPWLARRVVDSFWLSIYDSVVPGVLPRPLHRRAPCLGAAADVIAFERPAKGLCSSD